MRLMFAALTSTLALAASLLSSTFPPQLPLPSVDVPRLEDLSWLEAERALTPETVVVIPLGAASVEHGPHLKLGNDRVVADYLSSRLAGAPGVVVAPTLTYHYYPAFVEYPGTVSLSLAAAREITTDLMRSLTRFGPRRFYILNTAPTSAPALDASVAAMAADGVLVRYTNLAARLDAASRGVREQAYGAHADEIETSMMLYIDPSRVDMTKAVPQVGPSTGPLRLTRQPGGTAFYSPSGVHGDPTLASRDKGRHFVDSLVAGILEDIKQLRAAPLPDPPRTIPANQPLTAEPRVPPTGEPQTERCSAGDERTIRALGSAFAAHWANADALSLGLLWSRSGDIVHGDGTVERGREIITQNRFALFGRREYRGSRHPLVLNMIRCLSPDIAVADGKWELRGVVDKDGRPMPTMSGLVTLVAKRGGGWLIEAYRYTVTPAVDEKPGAASKPGSPTAIIK
jgi:creatinine amidohydrolase